MNNERSLAKEITEGFEALKSMRNNEPLAWMMVNRENTSAYLTFEKPTRDMKISHQPTPLYTHPVKELTAQEVMEQTHKKISEAHWKVKEPTDEEIIEELKLLPQLISMEDKDFINFARAILRKAQEK